ncbi:MAG: Do family serine endopeptidase [Candidatus Dasytiphilus stammeri]
MRTSVVIFTTLLAIMGISIASTAIKHPVNLHLSKIHHHIPTLTRIPTIKHQVNDNLSKIHQIPTLAPIISKVMPSVVNIQVEGIQTVKNAPAEGMLLWGMLPFCAEGSPFQDSPFCKAQNGTHPQKFSALASGIILNAAKGYVVTNYHVIKNTTKIAVTLNDGRRYEAKIIGKDPLVDIALLQLIDFKDLTDIKFADSDSLQVGDYTIAIGNAYGFPNTVTSGIISALGRSTFKSTTLEDFIQTDAPINAGNSGGALVNLKGELIGMNSAIYSPENEEGYIGIGFAIPSNMVQNITSQLIKYGTVNRGTLGIDITNLTSSLAKSLKINIPQGVFVNAVPLNSTAHTAGIKSGDVIISLNNKSIDNLSSFRAYLSSFRVGTKVSLGLWRDGKIINVQVPVEKIKHYPPKTPVFYRKLGLDGAVFSNIEGQKGIKVDSIQKQSNAFILGLRQGDIILSINKKPVKNVNEFNHLLLTTPEPFAFLILRGDNTLYLLLMKRCN